MQQNNTEYTKSIGDVLSALNDKIDLLHRQIQTYQAQLTNLTHLMDFDYLYLFVEVCEGW